jgi:hypothetical protein
MLFMQISGLKLFQLNRGTSIVYDNLRCFCRCLVSSLFIQDFLAVQYSTPKDAVFTDHF